MIHQLVFKTSLAGSEFHMSNFQKFDKVLLHTLLNQYKILAVVLFVLIGLLIVECFCYSKKNLTKGISVLQFCFPKLSFDNRLSLQQQIKRKLLGIILVLFIMILKGIPVYQDISNQSYIQVYACVTRTEESSRQNLMTNGYIRIETEKESITLNLPADWNEQAFPEGLFYGNVWYSKESRIILSFTKDTQWHKTD